jgi:hypothetical protein
MNFHEILNSLKELMFVINRGLRLSFFVGDLNQIDNGHEKKLSLGPKSLNLTLHCMTNDNNNMMKMQTIYPLFLCPFGLRFVQSTTNVHLTWLISF